MTVHMASRQAIGNRESIRTSGRREGSDGTNVQRNLVSSRGPENKLSETT